MNSFWGSLICVFIFWWLRIIINRFTEIIVGKFFFKHVSLSLFYHFFVLNRLSHELKEAQ